MAFHYPDHGLAMDAAASSPNSSFSPGGGEREKVAIAAHPLYERLLEAHVACLRVATPVDQLPRIDAQIAARPPPLAAAAAAAGGPSGGEELDLFMTHYVLLLCSFKEQLQQHVRVHAMEAVMGCWELEQSLQSLTGASPGEGTGATMSDDEDNQVDSETNMFDGNDGSDGMGFGPLILTEGERSLVERVRLELKSELKQGYKEKLVDIREEILRKRRAGKLPGDTASTLKAWWQAHSKWPYPTEDDKARLVQETGLQLKQINNWFINQRKRNWHSNPASSGEKTKKKREMLQVMAARSNRGRLRFKMKLDVNSTLIVKSAAYSLSLSLSVALEQQDLKTNPFTRKFLKRYIHWANKSSKFVV